MRFARIARLIQSMAKSVGLAVGLWTVFCMAIPAEDQLPDWSRSAFVQKVSDLWGLGDVEPKLEADRGKQLLVDTGESATCFVSEGESVWSLGAGPDTVSGPLTYILMVGKDDRIHTIHIFFPIVAAMPGDETRAIEVLQGLFQYLLPNWVEAAEWPRASLSTSWRVVAKAMEGEVITREQANVRATVSATKLVTFGVPPDFVDYRITARPDCEIISAP